MPRFEISRLQKLQLLVVAVLSSVNVGQAFREKEFVGPFERWTWWLPFVIPLLIILVAYWTDRRAARSAMARWPYASSAVALLAIVIMAGRMGYVEWRKRTPSLLVAGQFMDFNGSSLDLKADGRYRYCD